MYIRENSHVILLNSQSVLEKNVKLYPGNGDTCNTFGTTLDDATPRYHAIGLNREICISNLASLPHGKLHIRRLVNSMQTIFR